MGINLHPKKFSYIHSLYSGATYFYVNIISYLIPWEEYHIMSLKNIQREFIIYMVRQYSHFIQTKSDTFNWLVFFSYSAWWRHQVETFSALLAICAVNSPVTGEFPHKNQWRGAVMFSLICASIKGWINNVEAGDLRRRRALYDVSVMGYRKQYWCLPRLSRHRGPIGKISLFIWPTPAVLRIGYIITCIHKLF